ncbi:MAG: hypothetical protein FWC64_05740 [Treponema sp.]|nr:hypothetical protein [Treponema sp.]
MENNRQLTDPSGTIVFDSSSGISLEEQQEILDGINAMTGTNRLVSEATVIKAKRRGFLFPVLVNVAAVVLLAAGFVLLSHFHVQEEQGIREGSVALGVTERALIHEIRQETSRLIREKEDEINSILQMLFAADSEYRLLQDSLEVLTESQQARAAALLQMQEDYRHTLSGLHEERARILEDSRLREAVFRAQAEDRARELTAAMEELQQLSAEHERVARAESQMSVYFASANSFINEGRLDEASAVLGTMREFLAAPSLQGIRAMETRRQTHLAAIGALEMAVAEALRLTDDALVHALTEMQTRYAALEQQLEAQEQVIAAAGASGTEQTRIIAEHASAISELQVANASRDQVISQRESEIQTLRTENTGLQAQVQTTAARAQQSEAELENQRTQYTALSQRTNELQNRYDELQQRLEAALALFQ